jgi:hypothetical protein
MLPNARMQRYRRPFEFSICLFQSTGLLSLDMLVSNLHRQYSTGHGSISTGWGKDCSPAKLPFE